MGTVELEYDVQVCETTRADLNPIVFIHGFTWNKFLFRSLARDLCRATNRKVFCLDLRNHGESPSTDDVSIDLMTKDVKRFMAKHHLKKVAFVCHSFSNSIAYTIALDEPDAVEKLLMIDNPPFNDFNEEFSKESVYPQLWIQNRLLKTLDNRMSLKDARDKFHSLAKMTKKGQHYFYKKVAYDLTKENGKFRWKKDFDHMMECYKKGLLSFKPRGFSEKEILIIRCPNSGRVPDSKFEAVLRHNPNARLMTFEGTTHLLMFEEPEKFIEAAKTFLHSQELHFNEEAGK